MNLRTRACGALVFLLLATASFGAVVIEQVRIVDVIAGSTSEPQDVTIEAERIIAIGSAPAGSVTRIDGHGKFLVPGFWDMHAHINEPRFAERWELPLLLAAGVTGVRDMAGDCWSPGCEGTIRFTRELQSKLQRGEIPGPRVLAIASAVVGGPRAAEPGMPDWATPATAAQAKRLVREVKRSGADLIKAYDTMPRAAYFAMVREARARGIPVAGHVPLSVTTIEALQAGQQTIDHAKHPALDCSRFSRTFHEVFATWAAGDSERIYRGWADDTQPENNLGSYYPSILATYDAALCRQVITAFAASGAYYVPTLITRRFEAFADDSSFLDDARLASVPQALRSGWMQDSKNYQRRFTAAGEKRAYVEFYELAVRLVGDAHRAGVPVLIGTDTPDSFCFPGSGYHDEMIELRKAGLSNADILRAATITAAKFMGLDQKFGSVSAGKSADLVLLEADPLVDITNARKIAAVVSAGRVFDRKQLDELERGAAAFARGDATK